MKIYNNIEFLQLNFDELTDRYYFPQNSKIAGKKIDSIGFLATSSGMPMSLFQNYSPIDKREVISENELQNIYVDIVNDEKEVLHSQVPAICSDIRKRSRIMVGSPIDLELCCVFYAGDPADIAGKCLIAYVTYDTVEESDYQPEPMQCVTLRIENAPAVVKLSDYIQDYIIANKKTIKAVSCNFNYNSPNAFYLDLRDYAGRSFRYVHAFSFQQAFYGQRDLFMLADFSVDFFNSYVIAANPNITNNYKINLYYE